ncbi:alpha-acetolactate decarboxylase [Ophiostoma piceae UAMH 11346]|uniref:Alpha-acetolactate decarboxylase n=1 Tax=Ophiostoma piceae (strain UAMH 11346) TaxID=1262450 RepID=S3C773_OPHP1|nr:alpha-acetolactate decarboxylase [Ophiostoma piceae UAMH 11346]
MQTLNSQTILSSNHYTMAANVLYQYSVMAALMDGVAEQGLPLDRLHEHGNFGLGTFRHMAGEMAMNEGRVWQMTSDGGIRELDTVVEAKQDNDASCCPFAMVTNFQPTIHDALPVDANSIKSKDDFSTWLDDRLPANARNQFVALRLKGSFASVTIRVIPAQRFRGQKLAELTAAQSEHTATELRGTVVGFRSPGYAAGFGVPGLHLHFLSDDDTYGGHILALDMGSQKGQAHGIKFEAAIMSKLHLELPTDDADFNNAPLKPDLEAIQKAEG